MRNSSFAQGRELKAKVARLQAFADSVDIAANQRRA